MKKNLSTLILISLITLFALPTVMPVFAGITGPPGPTGSTGGGIITSVADVDTLITKIAQWFSKTVLAIAVIFILVAAWTFLTAGGNPDNITKAKTMLIYALIGIAVAVLAWGMESLITDVLTPTV